ncbi:MAG: polysaccharide biosynthesis tyrosine autokinase [Candidatus Omnitrophota bacterium]
MAEYALNLWDYWRIIYKRKWIIMAIFLISLMSIYFFGKKEVPVYKSSVTLYINTKNTPVAEITGSGVTFWGGGSTDISTQIELIRSYEILRAVAERLDMVSAEASPDEAHGAVQSLRGSIAVSEETASDLVVISAVSAEPVEARDIVQTVADVFMEKSWEGKIEEAKKTKLFIEKQLDKIDQNMNVLKKKMRSLGIEGLSGKLPYAVDKPLDLRTRLLQLKLQLADLEGRYTEKYPGIVNIKEEIRNIESMTEASPEEELEDEIQYEDLDVEKLKNELMINQGLYTLLKERYEKASILEASKTRDIEIVNPPFIPTSPVGGKVTANFMMAGAIGLVLGFVAAFVTESLDTSIGTIEDVEEFLKIPVLGVIPHIEIDKKNEADYWKKPPPPEERKAYSEIMGRLVIQYQPKSSVSEAYRNLQTYIKFSGLDKVGNCLMFTSAGIREGKTMTAVNSALSMAQMGYKVALIDADLRRPAVHKVFGIKRELGLSEVILGTFKLEDVIKTIDDVILGNIKSSMIMKTYGMENLHLITSGHLPSNPAEVLGSQNLVEFIKEVKSKFQVVLFDSAPVLPVTDSCILGSRVDGVVLVYKAGYVSRGALRRCKMQIENANGKPVGVVLNSMRASDMKFGSPFYYYYQKYYGETENEA